MTTFTNRNPNIMLSHPQKAASGFRGSENMKPSAPKPRSFSQTTKAPSMRGVTVSGISSGTTGNGGRVERTTGPLSVPRSGCCGRK